MKHIHRFFISLFVYSFIGIASFAQQALYKQSSAPIEQRVSDLLQRMTLEEKIAQIRHLHSFNIFNGQELDKDKLERSSAGLSWGFVEGFPFTGASF